MTKYTATFKDGTTAAATSEKVKNNLDFYNSLIKSGEAKKHGGIEKIEARPFGKN